MEKRRYFFFFGSPTFNIPPPSDNNYHSTIIACMFRLRSGRNKTGKKNLTTYRSTLRHGRVHAKTALGSVSVEKPTRFLISLQTER